MIDPLIKNNMLPLSQYLQEGVSDIYINKIKEVILQYNSGKKEYIRDLNITYKWLIGFSRLMVNLSGKEFQVSPSEYSFDLPGGHRAQLVIGEVKLQIALAIRLNFKGKYCISDYTENSDYIIQSIKDKKNILISGGTGSGKTSFLNTVLDYVNKDERIITIEDVREIKFDGRDCLNLIYNNEPERVLNSALRLNPDRLIAGELRQKNAMVFYRALNTGHPGSMATIHANSANDAISSFIDHMVANGDISPGSYEIIYKRIMSLIDLFIHVEKVNNSHEIRIGIE